MPDVQRGKSSADLAAARELRAEVHDVIGWLKSDLFEEDRCQEERCRAFRNPGGFRVVFRPREDRRGLSGWIEGPDGKALVITSHLDVQHLEEYLP